MAKDISISRRTLTVSISLLGGINAGIDGCKVVFPIQMYSYIKFSPLCYSLDGTGSPVVKNRWFSEVVSISVVKQRC